MSGSFRSRNRKARPKAQAHPGPEKERDPAIANSARPDLNLQAGLAVRFMHFFVFAQFAVFYWEIAAILEQLPRRGLDEFHQNRSPPVFQQPPAYFLRV
jgi:hypothetical protein